jgi:membrane AbrB-like protein
MTVVATLAAAAAGVLVARLVRLPGGSLLGALFGAAVLHLMVPLPPLPSGVQLVAQIAIGAVIGARIRSAVWRDARQWAPAFGAALVALVVAAVAGAQILVLATDLPWRTALLAVAPGGAADTTALAVAAGADAPAVAAVHITRQILVLVGVGASLRWWVGRERAGGTPDLPPRPTAGAVVWRGRGDAPEILLVHRPRYNDWSLPKGGVDAGETAQQAAAREALEETGWRGVIGDPVATVELRERRGPHGRKQVQYFELEAVEYTGFEPSAEVDATRWVSLAMAGSQCSRPQDREVLRRFAIRRAAAVDPSGPDAEHPDV